MNKRVCTLCKIKKLFSEFHKHRKMKDGIYNQCKKCRKEVSKEDYEKRKESIMEYGKEYRKTERGKEARAIESLNRRRLHPLKYQANYKIRNAIRDGKLRKRNICEICYAMPTECHHEDYSKPFDIIELCKKCHRLLHKQLYANQI